MTDDLAAIPACLIPDVASHDWWPCAATYIGRKLDSLWIPVGPEEEPELLRHLGMSLSEFRWLASLVRAIPADGDSESQLVRRYPSLFQERRSRSEIWPVKGKRLVMECGIMDSRGTEIHDFMTRMRHGRGRSGGVALGALGTELTAWHSIAQGILWDAALALSPAGNRDFRSDYITLYLSLAAENGYMPLVPLDYHPLGGYVIFGLPGQVERVVQGIPGLQLDRDDGVISALYAHGGGFAL